MFQTNEQMTDNNLKKLEMRFQADNMIMEEDSQREDDD